MRQRRPDPPSRARLAGGVLTALFLSGIAYGLGLETVRGTEDLGLVAILVGGVGLVVWIGVGATLAQRRFPRGLPAPRTGEWQGVRGVELPEWSWGARATPLVLVLVTVGGLALGLGAVAAGRVVFGVPVLLAGLAGAYLLARFLLGRLVVRGGAWLTPDLVACQQRGMVSWVGWDDVEGVLTAGAPGASGARLPPGDVMVLARHGGAVSVGRATRSRPPRDVAQETYLVVDTRWLGLPPDGLEALLEHYLAHREARPELASEAGVRRAVEHAHEVVRSTALR